MVLSKLPAKTRKPTASSATERICAAIEKNSLKELGVALPSFLGSVFHTSAFRLCVSSYLVLVFCLHCTFVGPQVPNANGAVVAARGQHETAAVRGVCVGEAVGVRGAEEETLLVLVFNFFFFPAVARGSGDGRRSRRVSIHWNSMLCFLGHGGNRIYCRKVPFHLLHTLARVNVVAANALIRTRGVEIPERACALKRSFRWLPRPGRDASKEGGAETHSPSSENVISRMAFVCPLNCKKLRHSP